MYGNSMDTDNCTKLFAYECWRYLTNCCLDLFLIIDSVVSSPARLQPLLVLGGTLAPITAALFLPDRTLTVMAYYFTRSNDDCQTITSCKPCTNSWPRKTDCFSGHYNWLMAHRLSRICHRPERRITLKMFTVNYIETMRNDDGGTIVPRNDL